MIPAQTIGTRDHGDAAPPGALRLLGQSLGIDLWLAWRHLVLGIVAGTPLMPRIGRFLIYRMWGLRVETANIWPGCTILGAGLRVGPATFINRECFFESIGEIEIGSRCQIGMQVIMITSNHDLSAGGAAARSDYRPVRIGDDVWIGARAMILPGVTVADGAVIAAGSVVNRDLRERAVYAGVPARKVRDL